MNSQISSKTDPARQDPLVAEADKLRTAAAINYIRSGQVESVLVATRDREGQITIYSMHSSSACASRDSNVFEVNVGLAKAVVAKAEFEKAQDDQKRSIKPS